MVDCLVDLLDETMVDCLVDLLDVTMVDQRVDYWVEKRAES